MSTERKKNSLPPFKIRKGETEDEARCRWLESLSLEQMKEYARTMGPKAKRLLEQFQRSQRKRQKAS